MPPDDSSCFNLDGGIRTGPESDRRGNRWLPTLLSGRISALAVLLLLISGADSRASSFESLAGFGYEAIYRWTDTCNVYVIRNGERAILIDLGDGSVLDHLEEIGVKEVEWVLLTHHHREQIQGHPRLRGTGIGVAGPEGERELFENPTRFRKMRPQLSDRFSVYGSSYVRPPVEPLVLDRRFKRMDRFQWGDYEFWVVETPGNSPAAVSYMVNLNGHWLGFSGDVILDDSRMHTWFDSEWDYSFASGIYALYRSAVLLEKFEPRLLLPSHGPVIQGAVEQLRSYQEKLKALEGLVLRGYPVHTFAISDQDPLSKPTAVPHLWQVSPHLFKFRGPNFWPNFSIIMSDTGHGLVVDCGLIPEDLLDDTLEGMRQRLGLKKIDAMLISHMHGDHFLQAPFLRETWGAEVWVLDRMVDQVEHPERYDYVAAVQAYPQGFESLPVDRVLRSGEVLRWQEYEFTVDWMPGQTEFAMCLHGMIDGKKVAFTGDNIFANPQDPSQNGHEAIVARNSGILEEGYIYGAELLKRIKPDLLMGGHSWVMPEPAALIERYHQWSLKIRDAFREISSEEDYRYWFDPFWIRAEPYRVRLHPGDSAEVQIWVRNFASSEQLHQIKLQPPPGLVATPAAGEVTVPAEQRMSIPVAIRAERGVEAGVRLIAIDVTVEGKRYGQRFDFMVEVAQGSSP
ncbi:MAG TPA: MBL fold metallo-hydrolase [Acidobacteriota bacterium]|nr:MBL fold metallo-hydrolase [Acidobacteriota bacterium]